jgi:hypothetical protein
MLIARIGAYESEELLVNSPRIRTAILEKADMQKRPEKWVSQISANSYVGDDEREAR